MDVDAAPYDWRLPVSITLCVFFCLGLAEVCSHTRANTTFQPIVLESRYMYFTNTIRTIEQLYKNLNNTRVVFLCHSLGCKVCHYLLNFALGVNGQAWINEQVT